MRPKCRQGVWASQPEGRKPGRRSEARIDEPTCRQESRCAGGADHRRRRRLARATHRAVERASGGACCQGVGLIRHLQGRSRGGGRRGMRWVGRGGRAGSAANPARGAAMATAAAVHAQTGRQECQELGSWPMRSVN